MKPVAGGLLRGPHYGEPPSRVGGFIWTFALTWREKIKRISTGFSILFLTACAPKKPLMVLPSANEVRLESENRELRSSLEKLEKNCSAVLGLFKKSQAYSDSPASKGK